MSDVEDLLGGQWSIECGDTMTQRISMKRKPRYDKEEFAQRGGEIYERRVRPFVEAGNRGKIVAIDIESEDYEVAEDVLTATRQLFGRIPDAQPWIVRVGYPAVHRFGPRNAVRRDDSRRR